MEWILSTTKGLAYYRMRNFLKSKQHVFLFALFFAIFSIGIWHFQSCVYPQFLTSSDTRIFTYFNLKKIPVKLVDQLYSQGEDVFAFGYKSYFLSGLNEDQLRVLSENLNNQCATETDEYIILLKKRANIEGKFKLFKGDSPYQIVVTYSEIKHEDNQTF